jgi:hypothetical protein
MQQLLAFDYPYVAESGGGPVAQRGLRRRVRARPQSGRDYGHGAGQVQNGYVSSGTRGLTRPRHQWTSWPVSSENVPLCARARTRVPYSSFPRNEGVRGSNPRVGFPNDLQGFYRAGNARDRCAGTKRVHLRTPSQLVEGSGRGEICVRLQELRGLTRSRRPRCEFRT